MTAWPKSVEAEARIIDAAQGLVETVPARKRVAVVGYASSSAHLAPWQDPDVELWGLNVGYRHFQRRPDRWFELHVGEARTDPSEPTYLRELRDLGCPVYMTAVDPEFPLSIAYPLERVRAAAPALLHRYFTSSAAYMIALAVADGFEEIGVYGIDCTVGSEYEQQKPAIEAWLMLAAGRGINVVVPPESALFKVPFMYCYEPPRTWPKQLVASESFLLERIKVHEEARQFRLRQHDKALGAIEGFQMLARKPGRRYAVVTPAGEDTGRAFMSSDDGATWAPIENAEIAAVIVASDEAARVHWDTYQKIEGAIEELRCLLTFTESTARGAKFPSVAGEGAADGRAE